jgi:predicted alpha/beta superfamily hydrolase|tara:strand:- start:2256 stop:3080 length:825 start_codon:yes stop_codon:yes gene_type:complete
MELIKKYQIRGVPGEVARFDFAGRTVEMWAPQEPSQNLLIAHDGQNVFDGKSSTYRGKTWEMAQHSFKVGHEMGIVPPVIIAIWHSSSKSDPMGRAKDLSPQLYFQQGVPVNLPDITDARLGNLRGDSYLENIFEKYVPELLATLNLEIAPAKTALIGSSMGGLSTLYAMHKHPEKFNTALALSPHWPIGGNELVERTISELPVAGSHKVWMSRGTKGLDAEYEPFQLLADRMMQEKGYRLDRDYVSKVFKKTGHNESSWASYLDQPLRFWLAH